MSWGTRTIYKGLTEGVLFVCFAFFLIRTDKTFFNSLCRLLFLKTWSEGYLSFCAYWKYTLDRPKTSQLPEENCEREQPYIKESFGSALPRTPQHAPWHVLGFLCVRTRADAKLGFFLLVSKSPVGLSLYCYKFNKSRNIPDGAIETSTMRI